MLHKTGLVVRRRGLLRYPPPLWRYRFVALALFGRGRTPRVGSSGRVGVTRVARLRAGSETDVEPVCLGRSGVVSARDDGRRGDRVAVFLFCVYFTGRTRFTAHLMVQQTRKVGETEDDDRQIFGKVRLWGGVCTP